LASLLAGLGIFMLRLEWLVSMCIMLHGGHIIILQVRLVIVANPLAGHLLAGVGGVAQHVH
jgi:hypothetical protein